MSDPNLVVQEQNTPNNLLERLEKLERMMVDLQTAEGPTTEETTRGGVSVFDLAIFPAEGVTVTEPTSADYTGGFIASEGITFGTDIYNIGGVNAGVLQWAARTVDGQLMAGNNGVLLGADGIVINSDGTPFFIFNTADGLTEVARLFHDGAGNLQLDLVDDTKGFTINDGHLIVGHATGVDGIISFHENFTRKAHLWWDASEKNVTLENVTNTGNLLLALKGDDKTERVTVFDRTAGYSIFKWHLNGAEWLREQSSAPPDPDANYGALYALDDGTLHYTLSDGTDTDLTAGGTGGGDKYPFEARLTLETGVAVSTSDQLAKTHVYITPHNGDQIAVFDAGGTPTTLTLGADIDLSLAGLGRSQAYTNDPAAGSNIVLNATDTTGFVAGFPIKVSSSAGSEVTSIVSIVANTSVTVKTLALNHTTSSPLITVCLPYDVFVYNNGGTLAAELLAWTDVLTRATALGSVHGIPVKSGDNTRRYVGTICTTTNLGECEESSKFQGIDNYYNPVLRFLTGVDTTNSWNYTTASFRPANNDQKLGVGIVMCICGTPEKVVKADVVSLAYNSTSGGVWQSGGVGIDSITVNSAAIRGGAANYGTTAGAGASIAIYKGRPGIGAHFIQRLEISLATGTTTWIGDIGGAIEQTGMSVEIKA